MTSENWDFLRLKIAEINPELAILSDQWRNQTINQYSNALWDLSTFRKIGYDPYLGEILNQQQNRLGLDNHSNIERALANGVVLSAHHTATLSHNISLDTLIVAIVGNQTPKDIIVLSSDWIPMDNLFYPRGFLVQKNDLNYAKINLYPKSIKKKLAGEVPAFTEEDVQDAVVNIHRLFLNKSIDKERLNNLLFVLEDYFLTEPVQKQHKYNQQSTLINQAMCTKLFPQHNFIFVNLSDITNALFIHELNKDQSPLQTLLFNSKNLLSFIAELEGEPGCWNRQTQQGSLLFWQLKCGKLVPFTQLDNNRVINSEVELALTKTDLITALNEQKIIPGMALTFILLMFCQNLICVGGMRQIAYCSAIKKAFLKATKLDRYSHHPVDKMAAGLSINLAAHQHHGDLFALLNGEEISLEPYRNIQFQKVIKDSMSSLLALSQ